MPAGRCSEQYARNCCKGRCQNGINGLVRDDPLGELICNVLKQIPIDIKGVCTTKKIPTGLTIGRIDEKGDRSFYSVQTRKSYEGLSQEDLNYELIDEARVFNVGGAMFGQKNSFQAVSAALSHIKQKEKRKTLTCCDLNWRPFLFDRQYAKKKSCHSYQNLMFLSFPKRK